MTAIEKRKKVLAQYQPMLGRNFYSQDVEKRECAVQAYKDGKYYSDCSSSIRRAYRAAGVGLDNIGGNTAGIHQKGRLVPVTIKNGQIVDPEKLREGDCLMLRGEDSSRPLQIGHVEMYVGSGKLWGHGSGHPTEKDMVSYLATRFSRKAANGKDKGIVEVRRFIEDDPTDTLSDESPISTGAMGVIVTSDLNIRKTPGGKRSGMYQEGEKIIPIGKAFLNGEPWFRTEKGWISAKYLNGWIMEDHRWWYLEPEYTWPAETLRKIDGKYYAFDWAGWMITSDRIDTDGAIM